MAQTLTVVLLATAVCSALGGCGSAQYAEVRRYISHEEFAHPRSSLEADGPVDAQGWALLAQCCLYEKDYLGLATAAKNSLTISGAYRTQLDYYLQQAFVEQAREGIRAFDENNDPEALRLFNQLLVYCAAIREYMSPSIVIASQKIAALAGSAAIRLRDYPNARTYLEGLRAEWKNSPPLLERLAFIYYQMGEPELCVAACESLLVKEPTNGNVLELRAQACQQLGHPEATVNAYRDALEELADSPVLNRNIGIILFQLQDWKQARYHLTLASRIHPADSVSLLTMIGECLYNEGDYDGALLRFKRALDAEGSTVDLLRAAGACYRNLGDRSHADAAFREADRLTRISPVNVRTDSSRAATTPHIEEPK